QDDVARLDRDASLVHLHHRRRGLRGDSGLVGRSAPGWERCVQEKRHDDHRDQTLEHVRSTFKRQNLLPTRLDRLVIQRYLRTTTPVKLPVVACRQSPVGFLLRLLAPNDPSATAAQETRYALEP